LKTNIFKRGGRYYNFSEVVIALLIAIRHETISIDTGNRFIEAIITKDSSKIPKKEMELFSRIYSDCCIMENKWFTNRTKDNHVLCCVVNIRSIPNIIVNKSV
jgi:hypothetical protein